jgi:hypothetical protein
MTSQIVGSELDIADSELFRRCFIRTKEGIRQPSERFRLGIDMAHQKTHSDEE